jgi:diguanylate cyclase (GGDEF)-like protein
MHTALCIFFYCIGVTILYVFNIASVVIYLLLLFLVSRVKHMERWMLVPFAEVLVHVLLCNLCLGWGYGFSLYGFMLIPVIYYIACIHMKSRIGVVTSSVLGIFDLLVIVHSASSAGEINKLPGMSNHEMLVIFAINVAICTIFLMAYSAYFVVAIRSATNVLEERNDELDFMVHYDALTNMRNRQNMDEIFEEYECYEKDYCVVQMDLDNFKQTNRTYGHSCGDELLINLSYLIRQAVRNRGEVCRWGGDEVLLLLKMDKKSGYRLTEKIRKEIADYVLTYQRQRVSVTATFGFVYCDEKQTMKERIALADSRLNQGKEKGKNQVVN